ncbi:translocation/assembly module TamB domain-containing protein, partial [bacterium]|nr:translocation/assembly module TamB domain-containing protein [bacterium]
EPKYSGKLALDHFGVDGKVLPAAQAELILAGKKINLKQFQWGSMSGSGEFNFGSERGGTFQLMLENSNLDTIRALIAPGKGAICEPITGSVQLILNRRQLNGKAHLNARQSEIQCEFNSLFSPDGKLGAYSGHIKMRDMRTPTVFDLGLLAEPENAPRGTLSGRVDFQGLAGRLKALSGEVDFSNFKLGEWHFKQLKTAWEANDKTVKILKLEGRQPLGSLQVSAGAMHFMPDGRHALNLDLKAENFHFFLRRFHGEFKLKGTLGLKPVHDLQLEIASPDFGLDKYVFGDFRARVRYQGENLEIRTPPDCPFSIVGDLSLPPGGAVIFKRLTISDARHNYQCINAFGRIDDNGTSDFRVEIHDVPADMIARCLGFPQPWTGMANGIVHYTDPEQIPHIRIYPKIENGSVLGLPFDVFYGELVIDHDWLYFRGPEGAAVLRRYGKYTMAVTGKIPMPQDDAAAERMKGMEMDVRLSMPEGDLSYLVFVPHIASAAGKSSLELKLRGTMEYPSLSGRARILNGMIAPRLYAPEVRNVYADLKFEDNKMIIQRLEGRIGEGVLKVTAGSPEPWACIFRRLQPHQLNLVLDSGAEHLSMDATSDYEFVSADVKLNVSLRGTMEEPVIGGRMELANGRFTYPPRALSEYAREIEGATTRYDGLKLISRPNFWFYNDMVRAQIAPDNSVVLNGGQHDFSGEGRVEITKGTFSYLDTDFKLDPNEKTQVILQGRETPRLHGLAKTVIRDVHIRDEGRRRDAVIYLKVHGEIGALNAEFKSDPEMTKAQIVSLLTMGEDFSSWSGEEVDQKIRSGGAGLEDISSVLGRWAGKLLGRQIEKEIKKITPLDVIGIRLGGVEKLTDSIMEGDANTGSAMAEGGKEITGTSLLMNTQIDVGKYLTDDLFLNYRGILKEAEGEPGTLSWQSLVGLEYHLDPFRKIKIYKDFDVDSGQELFLGIEGRTEFKSWSPDKEEKEGRNEIAARMTPTPGRTGE